MKALKELGKKLLFLPLPLALPVVALGAGLLVYVFISGQEHTPLVYAAYLLSSYALVIACACVPQLIRLVRQIKLVNRLLSDYAFRTHTMLRFGLLLNLGFAVFKFAAGVVYSSYWLIALGVYYAILATMRFFLLRRLGALRACASDLLAQYRSYRVTGVMMLMLNVVMTAIIFQVVRDNQTYSYPGTLIYAFAAYAFYKIITAALNLFRRRGQDEPLFAAVRFLSLTVAMMSIFSMQTALLSTFGSEELQFRLRANTASGAVLCVGNLPNRKPMVFGSAPAELMGYALKCELTKEPPPALICIRS